MHTSEHEHIKSRKREEFLFLLLLYIACSSIFYCPRFQAFISLFASSGIHEPHPSSLPVLLGHGRRRTRRSRRTAIPCDLYALYALKNRLCTLCEDITPELTAYNAYRNENRRVRRAEGMKMYTVGDAYRLHTKCIQVNKESKRERFFLLLLLYIACSSIFYCSFFRHSRTPSRSLPAL